MIRKLLRINAGLAVVLVVVWLWTTFVTPPVLQADKMLDPPSPELSALLIDRGITIEVDYEVRVYGDTDHEALRAVLSEYGPFLVYDARGERTGTYTERGLASLR